MSAFQAKIVGDFCNIRCSYCRNRDFEQGVKSVMSIEKLERLFVFLNSQPQKKLHVNWHGGEPLLAGKDFFNKIVELEKLYPDKLWSNVVQTNAILIDSGWAKFFSKNHFHVGVSVDGSEKIHNHDRVGATGKGTYQKVMRGVNMLRSYGIHPGTICTVTKKSVGFGKEMFLGLVNAGFKSIAFNAFHNTASESIGDLYGLSDKEWLTFLIEIFEEWVTLNDPTVRVRELDSMLAWIKSKSANCRVYRGTCHQWFAVDDIGDIYPCERLGKEIYFGNIDSIKTVEGLSTNPVYLKWKDSIVILHPKCQSCNLQSLCHNGCVSHRKSDNGDAPLYVYCESRLGFYNYLQSKLTETEKEKGHE
ncbi:MAG: hypothetical protein A3D51_02315 [Candidatus Yonathbacteria bacterium RIFCSPHIGHO2_02_FULL_44_14]|uniref:Radical SAM core domain-containing protein n=1 Tax=Candidatus Yonathbacteria bacterium RIFCSPHIGHO2_02_FULL_44_14 TaxID=1802724 RepID=A0A1G2S8Y7_9BACT|nr:MAG: hypothetical protein A3D51_02315 [Candidatus Yonathbacteria bacterium RIFCSPHIGHO2_02_FULL_44_14]